MLPRLHLDSAALCTIHRSATVQMPPTIVSSTQGSMAMLPHTTNRALYLSGFRTVSALIGSISIGTPLSLRIWYCSSVRTSTGPEVSVSYSLMNAGFHNSSSFLTSFTLALTANACSIALVSSTNSGINPSVVFPSKSSAISSCTMIFMRWISWLPNAHSPPFRMERRKGSAVASAVGSSCPGVDLPKMRRVGGSSTTSASCSARSAITTSCDNCWPSSCADCETPVLSCGDCEIRLLSCADCEIRLLSCADCEIPVLSLEAHPV